MLKKVPHNDYHVPTHTCLNSSHEGCCRTPVAISSFDSLMIVNSLFCVTRHIQDLCIYHVYMQLTKICSWVSLRLFFLNDLLNSIPLILACTARPGLPLLAPDIDFLASHLRRPRPASTKTAIADFPHHAPKFLLLGT